MAWLRVRVSAFTCVLLGAMATACVAPPPESAPRQVAGAPEPTSTHVIVRFGTPPTEARLKDLEKAGLRVIEAFDRTTYVARADEALDLAEKPLVRFPPSDVDSWLGKFAIVMWLVIRDIGW